jgi:hypothetical protein
VREALLDVGLEGGNFGLQPTASLLEQFGFLFGGLLLLGGCSRVQPNLFNFLQEAVFVLKSNTPLLRYPFINLFSVCEVLRI